MFYATRSLRVHSHSLSGGSTWCRPLVAWRVASVLVSFGVPAASFVVLAVEQEQCFDHIGLLQGWGFQGHHLPLLPRESGSLQKVPALDLIREHDLVPSQLAVGLVVVRDEGQEGLLTLPLEAIEIGLKVVGQEDPVVILKVSVTSGQDLAEGVLLLAILNGQGR